MPRSATDYSDVYRARWSAASTPGFFQQLIPDGQSRLAVLTLNAESILAANALDSARWGITRLSDGVRVNAGTTESILAGDDFFALMVDVNAKSVAKLNLDPAGYRSAPDAAFVVEKNSDTKRFARRMRDFWPAHIEHLSKAVPSGLNGATRKGHDPSLIDEISAETALVVPQPSYVQLHLKASTQNNRAAVETTTFPEGARSKEVAQSKVERNPAARQACLNHHGVSCVACGFNFARAYGKFAEGLIHVHHLSPLGANGERSTDPVRDLRPVCPNCHLALHQRVPPIEIEELRRLLAQNR